MQTPPADLQAQLELLRRTMLNAKQRVEEKLAEKRAQAEREEPLEKFAQGREVETALGKHFETGRLWGHWQRHGSMEISRLQELPADLLHEISEQQIGTVPPERWVFLDTETSGLAGGSGTYAFMIGVGRICADGFQVRQFFLREFGEEASQLTALTEALADAEVLVTYNGKSFDVPLLESRYRMNRQRPPFARLAHLDLLYGARRLWRLRFDSCRLVELESRILGHDREDDVPGAAIPEIFFEYVRSRRAARLAPVFSHNALDIVSLACLTGIVPWVFREAGAAQLRHGAEFVALGRYVDQAGRTEQARDLLREAIRRPLRDDLMYRAMWDLADIERRLGAYDAVVALCSELATVANPHRADALATLAKHYEHREKNFAMALEFTETALQLAPSDELLKRRERLARKHGQTRLALHA